MLTTRKSWNAYWIRKKRGYLLADFVVALLLFSILSSLALSLLAQVWGVALPLLRSQPTQIPTHYLPEER